MCGKDCLGSKLSYIIAAAENTKRKSKVYVFSHQTNKSIIFLKSILLFLGIMTWQLKGTGQEKFRYFMDYFWTLKISTLVYYLN